MDLLYQKYASPFDFIQCLLDTGNLTQGFINLYDKENDRKLWELYLHSFPSESYEEWKKKVTSNANVTTKGLSQNEIETQVSKSNDILNTFSIERG